MNRRVATVLAGLLVVSLIASACGSTPAPQVVKETVKETVVVQQTVKETVMVEGTPQVVEKVITATPEPTVASATAKTFTVSWVSTDVTTFDPHVCTTTDCLAFMRAAYEGLVDYKYGTTEIEGRLAESWKVSDDGLNWTFTLRDGLKFSDGSPLTAEDVVYSFDRLAGMQKGASMYLGGVYASSQAVDDKTVTITLTKSMGPFLAMMPRVFIVNSKLVKQNATSDDPWAGKWMYDHDAGSGPYTLTEWEHGVRMSVVKNPNYWDPTRPKDVERFTVLYIAERATDQLLLEQGDIDALAFPDMSLLPSFKSNPDITVEPYDSFNGMNIILGVTVKPLDDIRVRKALSLAFDYDGLVQGYFQGYAVQAQGPLPKNMKYHDDTLPIYHQDLAQAKALLEEAGYPAGTLELEMLVITGYTPWVTTAQIMQQALAQIGVKLNIVEMPWTQIAARTANRDNPIQLLVINSFPSYPDPDAILYPIFHTSQWGGFNRNFYGDAEMDALLDAGRFSVNEADREAAYKAIQKRLVDEAPMIWLERQQSISVRRTWVGDYKYDPTWDQTFRPDMLLLTGKP
jgi:peptide/nickel transport system substrate-binding protein